MKLKKKDKLAILTEFGTPDTGQEQSNLSYRESLTRKVESLVRDSYPWLGDFVLTLVDTDPENEFAYGAARLSDYSGGFSVEFPVFYLEGKLMDIPAFVLAERDVSLPFNETSYRLIQSTLNSDDNIAIVRERTDVSDTMADVLNRNNAGPGSGLLKMSSLSRILANVPRSALKQYAKTAGAVFPELVRDMYSAVKLSRFSGNIKLAVKNNRAEAYMLDKKASLNTEEPSPMLSIVTPSFRSPAEYDERDDSIGHTLKITNRAFVLPEANNKVNLTPIPDLRDVVKSLNETFELTAPGELFEILNARLRARSWEPLVTVCVSNNEDYWLIPEGKPKKDRHNMDVPETESSFCGSNYGLADMLKHREMSVNDMGGVFMFDYNYRYGSLFKDITGKKVKDRVVYVPDKRERDDYFRDILDTPLSIRHDIVSLLRSGRLKGLPFRSENGRLVLMPLSLNSRMKDPDEYNVTYTTSDRNGKFIQNYFVNREESSEKSRALGDAVPAKNNLDLNKSELPKIKVVSDPVTGAVETLYIHNSVADWVMKEFYGDDSDASYIVLGFKGTYTYNPARFSPGSSGAIGTQLNPVNDSGEDRSIIIGRTYDSVEKSTEDLIRVMFDDKRLNPDFLLNSFPVGPDCRVDLGIPYMEIDIKADDTVDTVLPNVYGGNGVSILRVTYEDSDTMLRALGGAGVTPEDLSEIDNAVKEAAASRVVSGVPYNAVVTKLAYAVSPTQESEAKGLGSEAILQQLYLILEAVQNEQELLKKNAITRDKMIDKQFELLDQKLNSIDELKENMNQVLGVVTQQAEEGPSDGTRAPAQEEDVPPEVLQEMAATAFDPSKDPMGLGEEELEMLSAAAQGDEGAAQQIGLGPENHALLMKFYEELSGAAEQPVPNQGREEIPRKALEEFAGVVSDPEGAVSQGGYDQNTVDMMLAAVEGDMKAAEELGLDENSLNQIMQMVETQAGPAQEDVQELAQIIMDPEGAVNEGGIDKEMVDALVAAVNGDAAAAEQVGLDEATIQQVQQFLSQQSENPAGAPGEEGVPEEQKSTEEELLEAYEHAKAMVSAYLNPDNAEDLGVTPEDLGNVTIILRAPDFARRSGIPGNMIQAVSDAYMAMTGKPLYAAAEQEFSSIAGSQPGREIEASKNVISTSKDFEQYTKPLAETSALLDIIPRVKTAKLFFRNADDFKNMLKIMGEMMMNLQVNAVKYRDLMGAKSYERLLARIKKVYDDFGTMILQMYNLDTNSEK